MQIVVSTSTHWEESLPALRGRLVGRARRLGVDPASAEDLAQDALHEAWRLRDRVYDPSGIDRWVDAIFTNVHRRWAKRTGTERNVQSTSDASELAGDFDVEVELERGELADLLDRALNLLPAETRHVLIGHFIHDTPLGELARQHGLRPGALRMRLQRGKLALRTALTTTYADDAVSFGLLDETEAGWQETRIWCPACGTAHLRARFSGARRGVHFVCPKEPDTWWAIDNDTTALGVTGFRAILKKIGVEANGFWLDRLRGHDEHPHPRPVTWDDDGGISTTCSTCSSNKRTHPAFQALFTPDARQFWQDHPRLRTTAFQQVNVDGAPALLTSYQSVTSRARLDVVVARDTFRVLRSQRS